MASVQATRKCKQIAKIRNKYMNKKDGTRTKSKQKKHNKTMKIWDSMCLKRTDLQDKNVLQKEEKSWKLMDRLFPKKNA